LRRGRRMPLHEPDRTLQHSSELASQAEKTVLGRAAIWSLNSYEKDWFRRL
jgi:hypothetical protein